MGKERHEYRDVAADAVALPPLQVFRDIFVVPVSEVKKHMATGGPVWPAFDRQTLVRHCRDRLAVDMCAPAPQRARPLRHPAIWGGFLNPHFGHLIIEHVTRLPQSLRERPGDLVLFTLPPGMHEDEVPAHIWALLDWYGVPRRKVRLVTAPILVAELSVAAQPEMMGKVVPAADYLDILNAAMARNGMVAEPNAVVFVARSGLVARGMGGHIGEGYLCRQLAALGVKVIDPASLPVRRQIEIYAGAKALVFAEGSAMLGRHVLGFLPQDIHVLRRRPNQDLCAPQLAPRCRHLCYHAVVGRRLGTEMPSGVNFYNRAVALYDLPALFAGFLELGIDLSQTWNTDDYRQDQSADDRAWIKKCTTSAVQVSRNLAILRSEGIDFDHTAAADECLH